MISIQENTTIFFWPISDWETAVIRSSSVKKKRAYDHDHVCVLFSWHGFIWLSKVICLFFDFALLLSVIGYGNTPSLNQPIRSKIKQSSLAHIRFPALDKIYKYLLRVLTGWFSSITENSVRSIFLKRLLCKLSVQRHILDLHFLAKEWCGGPLYPKQLKSKFPIVIYK